MTTRSSILVLAVSLLALIFPSAAAASQRSFKVRMKNGPLNVVIEYNDKAWADYIVQQTKIFLPRAEKYVGIPFPYSNIRISPLYCTGCMSWNRNNSVLLNYDDTAVGHPAILLHELSHFWFRDDARPVCQEWFYEGIASFLPVAMSERGVLPNTPEYRKELERRFSFRIKNPYRFRDKPICPYGAAKRNILYTKAYRIQYLVYKLTGASRYQKLLKQYKQSRPHNNTAMVSLLNRFTKKNWQRLLRGWVFPGKYTDVSFSDFSSDDDSDGLSNSDEYILKTKRNVADSDGDTIPDGAEISLGLNPLVTDSNADEITRQNGPFVDGLAGEWEKLSYSTASATLGDVSGDCPWADIYEVNYIIKNSTLFVRVKTSGRPEAGDDFTFTLNIDPQASVSFDYQFAFSLGNPWDPWRFDGRNADDDAGPLIDYPAGIKAGVGEVMEMAVPLSLIPSTSFRIKPAVSNTKTGGTCDGTEWIPVG